MPFGVTWKELGRDLRREIRDDQIASGAAALAFYWMLSLFPAAIFLLTLLAYLPIPHLENVLMDLIREALPDEAAALFRGVVESVTSHRHRGLLSFGAVLTIWSTSSGTHAVMHQLNVAFDVEEHRPFWKTRVIALVLTLVFFVLVIGAFGLIVCGGVMQHWLADIGWHRGVLVLVALARWLVIILALLFGFALTYYLGPHVRERFRLVTPGNVLGVTMLILASVGFHLFVSRVNNFDLTYGSLGAAITLMLWLYLAGWAILLGGELDATLRVYRSRVGAT